MLKSQLPLENKILSNLLRHEYLGLRARLEACDLTLGSVIYEPHAVVQHVYFPCTCLISVLCPVDSSDVFTVGLLGREGLLGFSCALGSTTSPFGSVVLNSGRAYRMPVETFIKEYQDKPALRKLVNQYILSFTVQIAQTAACNRFHIIEERLARWLLMVRDKLSSNHFHMTHETLGQMIGVHRVGVTHAARSLKERHLIDYSRGEIFVLDGDGLEEACCPCYSRVTEYRYARPTL